MSKVTEYFLHYKGMVMMSFTMENKFTALKCDQNMGQSVRDRQHDDT